MEALNRKVEIQNMPRPTEFDSSRMKATAPLPVPATIYFPDLEKPTFCYTPRALLQLADGKPSGLLVNLLN